MVINIQAKVLGQIDSKFLTYSLILLDFMIFQTLYKVKVPVVPRDTLPCFFMEISCWNTAPTYLVSTKRRIQYKNTMNKQVTIT